MCRQFRCFICNITCPIACKRPRLTQILPRKAARVSQYLSRYVLPPSAVADVYKRFLRALQGDQPVRVVRYKRQCVGLKATRKRGVILINKIRYLSGLLSVLRYPLLRVRISTFFLYPRSCARNTGIESTIPPSSMGIPSTKNDLTYIR